MKTEQPLLITSILAAANLTKNLFVGFDGALCSANVKPLGVIAADTLSGEQMPVSVSGITLVFSGAAVALGAPVVSNAAGKAITATAVSVTIPVAATPVTSDAAQPTLVIAGSVLPQVIAGYAVDSASGADELIRVLLT
ncbi:MAG: capsid cement protein [Bacteroidota bacterium]